MRADPCQRPHPHHGCQEPGGFGGIDQERPFLRGGKRRQVTARSAHQGHRPARPHRGSGHHRQPQPHRADGQPPRLPHAARERAIRSRTRCRLYAARAAGAARPGAWITTIGGFHSNHLYANPSDKTSGRFPTLAELDSAVPNNPAFMMISLHRPGRNEQRGQGHPAGARRDGGPTPRPDRGRRRDWQSASTGCPKALLYLRQTLLNPAERRRSVIDAMNYALSVGVTTHLDQGAFQATNTTADGAAHEDNYTMHIPFLEIYDQGKGTRPPAHQLPAHGGRPRPRRSSCSG